MVKKLQIAILDNNSKSLDDKRIILVWYIIISTLFPSRMIDNANLLAYIEIVIQELKSTVNTLTLCT